MDKIGQRIKARREQLNISQDELASLTGYADKSAICRFESMGKSSRNIKIENLESFAKALRTTVPYLMGLTSDPELSLEEVINNDAQNNINSAKIAYIPTPKEQELKDLIDNSGLSDEKLDVLIGMIESWK